MSWFEPLPKKCPPSEAISPPEGFVAYRVCDSSSPESKDFLSVKQKQPNRKVSAHISPCIQAAVSIWTDVEKCVNLTKLPSFKGKVVAKLTLIDSDGVILKTSGPNHYSWWRSQSFDVSSVVVLQ